MNDKLIDMYKIGINQKPIKIKLNLKIEKIIT